INLGGGRSPTALSEMISKIETLLGKKAIIQGHPPIAADIKATRADIAKADKLLGWQPHTSFDDGLAATIAWHRQNSHWINSVL
ncbi:MAG TPA: hypothetical protein VK737_11570, partial [Opitutales bacterium]|nr:hypothetical protein [Opitutales bacterium]